MGEEVEKLVADLSPLVARVDSLTGEYYADRISIPTPLGYLRKVSVLCAALLRLQGERDEIGVSLRDEVTARLDAEAQSLAWQRRSEQFEQNERRALARNDDLWVQVEAMRKALERIERWHGEFPETGRFWQGDPDRPMSYGACYGSNGERDYMRGIARAALASSNPAVAQIYPGWKGVTQPCDVCGKPCAVNAVSPSECFCSHECGRKLYGIEDDDDAAEESSEQPPLDRAWAAVNVLGAPDSACRNAEDLAYCAGINDALRAIETLGGRPS